jgi:hypothetical protein
MYADCHEIAVAEAIVSFDGRRTVALAFCRTHAETLDPDDVPVVLWAA